MESSNDCSGFLISLSKMRIVSFEVIQNSTIIIICLYYLLYILHTYQHIQQQY